MSSIWGNNLKISIFGESHGEAIGVVVDGLPSGEEIDFNKIDEKMFKRSSRVNSLSTDRKEADKPIILSGVLNNKTEGTPLAIMIKNTNTKSNDYNELASLMRPSHADYTANIRYNGFQDIRGGGHFSGRLTAPLVAVGSICEQILEKKGIVIASHIKNIHGVEDDKLSIDFSKQDALNLKAKKLQVLNDIKGELMLNEIQKAKDNLDSVGGIIETSIIGIQAGIGSPMFNGIENRLVSILFGVPAVKGVEFGLGFDFASCYASECNDSFYYDDNQNVKTKTNNNGGINGGITNGMNIDFSVVIKPTPSIYKSQDTINIKTKQNEKIEIVGRHDPCIVVRAVPVIESVTAIAILDCLMER